MSRSTLIDVKKKERKKERTKERKSRCRGREEEERRKKEDEGEVERRPTRAKTSSDQVRSDRTQKGNRRTMGREWRYHGPIFLYSSADIDMVKGDIVETRVPERIPLPCMGMRFANQKLCSLM